MLDVAQVIFETAKTYLIQQGKFLAILFLFIGAVVAFYFGWLSDADFGVKGVLIILGWTVVGILGFIQCCLVRYQDEYPGQLQDGFCLA